MKLRTVVSVAAAVAVVGALGISWQSSLLPSSYSVMDHGTADHGGGPVPMSHHDGTSVINLREDPSRPADVRVDLTARQQRFALASGEQVDGFTLNGTSPGPVIRAVEGQLVEVRVTNDDVRDGVALHWHGVDVANSQDGVAGVTQDAVPPGATWTYRFVADHAGTFWYHSHQVSHAQVQGGLLGALVVAPRSAATVRDVLALSHVYGGMPTVNGRTGEDRVPARPGERVRVRVVNTDNGALRAWTSGSPYRVVAVDGREVQGPPDVDGRAVLVPAGGRVDLELTAPARVELGSTALMLGDTDSPASAQPDQVLDLFSYGTPAALPFDADRPDRRFRYSIGRRPGFLDGRPGLWWSVNGHLLPDVPAFVVEEGDVVVMTIANHSGATHPMHLHGHHAVVLSRNGTTASGSPWWVDSLEVPSGTTYEIALLADNPGIWMDHCHNLPHAAQGLVAHLVYAGVTTPYRVGAHGNHPE